MHTFQPRWPDDLSDWPIPDVGDFRFTNAHDAVRFSELEPVDDVADLARLLASRRCRDVHLTRQAGSKASRNSNTPSSPT